LIRYHDGGFVHTSNYHSLGQVAGRFGRHGNTAFIAMVLALKSGEGSKNVPMKLAVRYMAFLWYALNPETKQYTGRQAKFICKKASISDSKK